MEDGMTKEEMQRFLIKETQRGSILSSVFNTRENAFPLFSPLDNVINM